MEHLNSPVQGLPGTEIDGYRLPDGRPLDLFTVLAHSPAALADLKGATARTLQGTSLSARHRELVILRVLSKLNALAEWQVHLTLFGEAAELSSNDISVLRGNRWTAHEKEAPLLALADAVAAGGGVSSELWSLLHANFDPQTIVDAVFIAAQYAKVAIMVNVFEIGPPFPHGWEFPADDQDS